MTTRAIITLKDCIEELHFYRHDNGSPELTMPILAEFLHLISAGHVRDNATQSAGWLMHLGREELELQKCCKIGLDTLGWKYSNFEPISEKSQSEIDFFYTIYLEDNIIEIKKGDHHV